MPSTNRYGETEYDAGDLSNTRYAVVEYGYGPAADQGERVVSRHNSLAAARRAAEAAERKFHACQRGAYGYGWAVVSEATGDAVIDDVDGANQPLR